MNREDVARHQRARLYGGMIESISQRGYAATTVAHVIGLAGVSRRAFYEQFSNKEECFLATYDIVVARSRKLVLDAWGSERGWANRLHASCRTFLDDIVAEPKGAQLVLVDSLGIGPKARERLHLAGAAYERLVRAGFKASDTPAPLPSIAPRAIVGGVRHVVFNRLREDRVSELRTLADELLDWVEAYRSPATTRLQAVALKKPPDIPPAPAAFLAGDDKRARVLGSVVHLTLDEGYAGLTDPQIAQFAGISTEAFHKQFASKEECFLAVIDEFAHEALAAVEVAIGGAPTWPAAVHTAVDAFIGYLVAHPALLRMAFIDLFEVGPGMIGRMTKSIDRFVALVAAGGPEPRRAPDVAPEAITGAVWDIINAYAASDRLRYLPCLADHIVFVTLAPYIGAKVAIDTIEEARCGPRLVRGGPRAVPGSGSKPAPGTAGGSQACASPGRPRLRAVK
jgi:AcrR family transcriptional regulator